MAISWMTVLLQVVAGTIASFLVGMIWFSSYGLGRIWWSYTYPNKKYGECTGLAEGYVQHQRERTEREKRKRGRERGKEERKRKYIYRPYNYYTYTHSNTYTLPGPSTCLALDAMPFKAWSYPSSSTPFSPPPPSSRSTYTPSLSLSSAPLWSRSWWLAWPIPTISTPANQRCSFWSTWVMMQSRLQLEHWLFTPWLWPSTNELEQEQIIFPTIILRSISCLLELLPPPCCLSSCISHIICYLIVITIIKFWFPIYCRLL